MKPKKQNTSSWQKNKKPGTSLLHSLLKVFIFTKPGRKILEDHRGAMDLWGLKIPKWRDSWASPFYYFIPESLYNKKVKNKNKAEQAPTRKAVSVLSFRHVSLHTSGKLSGTWHNWEEEFSPLAKSINFTAFVSSVRAKSAPFFKSDTSSYTYLTDQTAYIEITVLKVPQLCQSGKTRGEWLFY